MKRYTVAVARERLAEALDAANRGVPVIIERHGVRYRLTRDTMRRPARAARRKRLFSAVDPEVLDGDWSWDWAPGGAELSARKKR